MSRTAFAVIGLPRSGTTWLANWLTTDRTLCLHDPFMNLLPEELEDYSTDKQLGISCTGAYALKWFDTLDCPIIAIDRDADEVDASLRKASLPALTDKLKDSFARARGKRYRFTDIWNEDKAREMWAFLLPDVPFNEERYRMLTEIQVQPHMGKWVPDMNIIETLIKRGELWLG